MVNLVNSLAPFGRIALANGFGDLHKPELSTAAEIYLDGISNTDTPISQACWIKC